MYILICVLVFIMNFCCTDQKKIDCLKCCKDYSNNIAVDGLCIKDGGICIRICIKDSPDSIRFLNPESRSRELTRFLNPGKRNPVLTRFLNHESGSPELARFLNPESGSLELT